MKIRKTLTALLAVVLSAGMGITMNADVNQQSSKGTAIVMAAFGTSYENAQKALFDLKKLAEQKYPDTKVVMSFSSNIIRKILEKRGQHFDSPAEAVKKLEAEGYKRIVIQSLQVIAGFEYDLLIKIQGKYENISVGMPLLASYNDMMKVLKLAVEEAPAARQQDEAIVLVGHGTGHPADLSYIAAADEIGKIDKNAFFCTVEGHITFKDVVNECVEKGIKKVYIVPFMSVAGDHAHNDMYGDKPGSLKSLLKDKGIESEIVMKGLGENKAEVKKTEEVKPSPKAEAKTEKPVEIKAESAKNSEDKKEDKK